MEYNRVNCLSQFLAHPHQFIWTFPSDSTLMIVFRIEMLESSWNFNSEKWIAFILACLLWNQCRFTRNLEKLKWEFERFIKSCWNTISTSLSDWFLLHFLCSIFCGLLEVRDWSRDFHDFLPDFSRFSSSNRHQMETICIDDWTSNFIDPLISSLYSSQAPEM